jgi:hypothetical protein
MVRLRAEIDEELLKVRTSRSTALMEVSAAATVTPLAGLGSTVVVVVVVGTVVVVGVGAVVVVVVVSTDFPAFPHGLTESYGTGAAPLGTATITSPSTIEIV